MEPTYPFPSYGYGDRTLPDPNQDNLAPSLEPSHRSCTQGTLQCPLRYVSISPLRWPFRLEKCQTLTTVPVPPSQRLLNLLRHVVFRIKVHSSFHHSLPLRILSCISTSHILRCSNRALLSTLLLRPSESLEKIMRRAKCTIGHQYLINNSRKTSNPPRVTGALNWKPVVSRNAQ